jgi:hypothetical protein
MLSAELAHPSEISMKMRTAKYSATGCSILSLFFIASTVVGSDKFDVELAPGWNAVSFLVSPAVKKESEIPSEITGLVAFRGGKTLEWRRGQDPTREAAFPRPPDEIQQQLKSTDVLDLNSLQANEGYLVYAVKPCKWTSEISTLAHPDTVDASKWTFRGAPVGAYLNLVPANEYSPPNCIPASSVFGPHASIYYLKSVNGSALLQDANKAASSVNLYWAKVDQIEPKDEKENSADWKLKQSEAVWVRNLEPADKSTHLEILPSSPQFTPNAVVLDFGQSTTHVDVQAKVSGKMSCVLGYREDDWFYSQKRPETQSILKAIASIGTPMPVQSGLIKITKRSEEPRIEFSNSAVALPYLESSHGPISAKRSIRVNTERKTKGSEDGNLSNRLNLPRVLKPGFYLGGLRTISTATNADKLPKVVVMFEVPELFGYYEGVVNAQVLSVRSEERESLDPKAFFEKATQNRNQPIEFEKLISAAQPGAKSIAMGAFPVRFQFSAVPGDENNDQIEALLEKKGSFIVSKDTRLSGSYKFSDIEDFYHVQVSLNEQKKTVFLDTGVILDLKIPATELPLMATPAVESTQDGTKVPSLDGDQTEKKAELATKDKTEKKAGMVAIRREIKFLLQEDSAGLLRGVMIERLGKSAREKSVGSVMSRASKDSDSGKLRTEAQVVYIIATVELNRVVGTGEQKK